jgi:hypothetical protein
MGTGVRELLQNSESGKTSVNGRPVRGKLLSTLVIVVLVWLALSSLDGSSARAETETSLSGLLTEVREVTASYEHHVVSNALQWMRITEGVKVVRPVRVPTNDMQNFPSPEHSLYPDYLSKRYSQFAYTVNEDGIVRVDVSSATTDELLGNMVQMAESYQR